MIGSGIGEFTIGGFPDADSLSVADPLPGLVSDPSLSREFLLRSTPGGETVDLSSSGYNSHPTDTPYQAFPSAISRPYNFSVELPLPDLSGGARLGAGEILVKNSDASLDATALHDWMGADLDVYLGRKLDPLTAFSRFSSGKSAGVSWGLDSFSILHRDARFKLQKRLQSNRYRGYGSAVRCDGAAGYLTGPVTFPAGSLTLEVRVKTLSNYVSGVPIMSWRNDILAGMRGINIGSVGTDKLSGYARNDAGTLFQTSALAVTYAPGTWRRVSMVLDTANLLIKLYVDGEFDSQVAVTGTFNTTLATMALCRYADLAVYTNAEVDDVRIWNTARTQTQIQETLNVVLNGTEPGLLYYNKLDEGAGTTSVPSVGTGDLTLTGGSTAARWVGTLEGDSSLAGTPKPVLVGFKRQINPKPVDPLRGVYQLHDGSMAGIDEVADGGDPYTFGSDVSDIYATTPAAGTYNTCVAMGIFRLGSTPVGVLTCIARGHNSSSLGYVDTVADCHRLVSTAYGGFSDSQLNLDTYAGLNLKTSATVGFYFDAETNVDTALDYIAKAGGNTWWSPDRVSNLSVGRIDPPETLSPEVEITIAGLVEPSRGGEFRRNPVGVRVKQVVLGYRRFNTVLTENQVAGTVDLETRYDLGKEYRFVTSPPEPFGPDDADTLTVYTEIDDPIEAQTEADRLFAFWSVDRGTYRVTMGRGLLSYFIGTPMRVTVNRYDTVGGKSFVVVGISEDMGQYAASDKLEPLLLG
jgi:hypothetical protein